MPRRQTLDISGQTFGRLIVIGRVPTDGKHVLWSCRCECGTEKTVRGEHLNRGRVVSCGCYGRTAATTHGQYKTPEYYVWAKVLDRCNNPRCANFKDYGGRGITVDPAWMAFERFLADMGPRPSSQHSIDRVDNDGPYCRDNCRWATRAEQSRNTRANVLLTHAGRTMTLTDWAAETGLTRYALEARIRYGWSVARALTEPVHR
jgi:hypothetical protein